MPPLEQPLGIGPAGNPGAVPNDFRQRRGRGQTSAASSKLNFDISGIQTFKRELKSVRDELTALRNTFREITKDTREWVRSLKDATGELRQMRSLRGGSGGGGSFSGGTPGGTVSFTGLTAPGGGGGLGPAGGGGVRDAGAIAAAADTAGGGAGAAGKGGGGAGAAAAAQLVAGAIAQGFSAVSNRMATGLSTSTQADIWLSRNAQARGVDQTRIARQMSASSPMLGSFPEVAQALNQFSTLGATWQAPGVSGARAESYIRGANMLQGLNPGTSPTEAAGRVTAAAGNIEGMRRGQMFFGAAAWMSNRQGRTKSMPEYFRGILQRLQQSRTGNARGKPYTREELEMARAPGSTINYNLSLLGWDATMISDFFSWAVDQAQYDPSGNRLFEATPDQLKAIGVGPSVAHREQLKQTAEGRKDADYYARQRDNMITQLKADESLINLQKEANAKLGDIYDVLSKVPGGSTIRNRGISLLGHAASLNPGGVIQDVVGGLTDIFASDVPIGDPAGLSQLNPDLRDRMGSMMRANPRLRVNSGFRTANEQKRLYESGHPFAAAPGHSRHTRGQAADLGPASELGWLRANAGRFGLETGTNHGEPWHVQRSGTMIGDITDSAGESLLNWRSGVSQVQRAMMNYLGSAYLAGRKTASPSSGGGSGGAAAGGAGAGAGGAAGGTGGLVEAPPGVDLGVGLVGPDGKVSVANAVKLLYEAGFRGDDLVAMGAIPSRESGYNPTAHALDSDDDSWGMWQVNFLGNLKNQRDPWLQEVAGTTDHQAMMNPWVAAQMAFRVYESAGKNLHPWVSDGNPLNNVDPNALTEARDAARQMGYIGDLPAVGGSNGGGYNSLSLAPVSMSNVFNVAVNGGNGVDVNKLVRQIADKLEPEMRRRQAMRR